MSDFWWSPDNVALLKKYWADGMSASQIASKVPGCGSRSAVIGKVHRLGLSGRAVTPFEKSRYASMGAKNARLQRSINAAKSRAKPATLFRAECEPLPPPNPDDVPTKTFAEIENGDCRFIPGDPRSGGKMFCGCPVVPGTSWCAHHLQRVSAAPNPRTDRPVSAYRNSATRSPADITKAVDELLGDRVDA